MYNYLTRKLMLGTVTVQQPFSQVDFQDPSGTSSLSVAVVLGDIDLVR